MKQNDWIIANINNPGFSPSDFTDLGMDTTNTQLLPESAYTKSQYIQSNPRFFGKNGQFDQQKFSDFYKQQVGSFGQFQQEKGQGISYDMFDSFRPIGAKVNNPNFKIKTIANPDRQTIGVQGINQYGPKTMTPSEIAQSNKVWDTAHNKWLDYSPNDNALLRNPLGYIKSIFSDPLVLATYDSAGEHYDPISHKMVHHEKGEYKLNDNGEYYTETLNGRSPIGKQVISSFDTITVDGEGLNKYDFMDSDGLDKNVTGTIFKSAATVAPLFMSPQVMTIYGGLLAAREIGKALPMLAQMGGSLFGIDTDNAFLNGLSAKMQQATGSTSQYSKENAFTFENVANLATDVATQWAQQKSIAQGIQYLRGGITKLRDANALAYTNYRLKADEIKKAVDAGKLNNTALASIGEETKWWESPLGKASQKMFVDPLKEVAKKQARLGADTSLAYMAIVSNTDVYEDLVNNNVDKNTAAKVAMFSAAGMFGVDRYLHLGEIFFDDLADNTPALLRQSIKQAAKDATPTIEGIATQANSKAKDAAIQNVGKDIGKKGIAKFFQQVGDKLSTVPKTVNDWVTQYAKEVRDHTTHGIGKALGEGIEEVAEEFTTDMTKQFIGQDFYGLSNEQTGAWQNMGTRYGMSLFGGALGGGIFYARGAINGDYNQKEEDSSLSYLIRSGKKQELLNELQRQKNLGQLGRTDLSASKVSIDDNGNKVFLSAEDENDSQNNAVYNIVRDSIDQIDSIINSAGANLNDDQLYDKMILSDTKLALMKDKLGDQSYVTGYQQDYQKALDNYIQAESNLRVASKTKNGTVNTGDIDETTGVGSNIASDENLRHMSEEDNKIRQQNLKNLQDQRDAAKAELDTFLNGERSLNYMRKFLFSLDPNLSGDFVSMNYETWLKNNKGKNIEDLTPAEANQYKQDYLNYKKSEQKNNLTQQFDTFLSVEKMVAPTLLNIQKNQEKFKEFTEATRELFNPDGALMNFKLLNEDSVLDGEEKNSKNQRPDEDYDTYVNRRNARIDKINKLNDESINALHKQVDEVISKAGGFIDPSTARTIHEAINIRSKDVAKDILDSLLEGITLPDLTSYGVKDTAKLKSIMLDKLSNIDTSNLDESIKNVSEEVRNLIIEAAKQTALNKRDALTKLVNIAQVVTEDDSRSFTGKQFKDALTSGGANTNDVEDVINKINEWAGDSGFGSNSITDDYRDYFINFYNNLTDDTKIEEMPEDVIGYLSEQLKDPINDYLRFITQYRDNLTTNPILSLYKDVDSRIRKTNPVQDLVKSFIPITGKQNLEQLLQVLNDRLNRENSIFDFRLAPSERENLDELKQAVKLAEAYVYATSTEDIANPIGHNISVNNFAKEHSDVVKDFEELPTISSDVANLYRLELGKYKDQIDYLIELNNRNAANQVQKLNNAEAQLYKNTLEYYRVNRDAFKFKLGLDEVDLLNGFDSLDLTSQNGVAVAKVQNLLYNNVRKILKDKDISFRQLLDQSGLVNNVFGGADEIIKQKTNSLAEDSTYDQWTPYTKFVEFVTAASLPPAKYYQYLYSRVQKETRIAPLTTQEQSIRIGLALLLDDNYIINDALQYIADKANKRSVHLPNIAFISGGGGTGKTTAVARTIASYIEPDKVWLSAPYSDQTKSLYDNIGFGQQFDKMSLLSQMIDKETLNHIESDLDSANQDSEYYNYLPHVAVDDNTILLLKDNVKVNILDKNKVPKLIVIDEFTHYNGVEQQIISKFAKLNGIKVIGLGDTNQRGDERIGLNVNRETELILRSPKLDISLRLGNIQMQDAIKTTEKISEDLDISPDDPLYDSKFTAVRNAISSLNYHVYNSKDGLAGPLITKSIDPNVVEILKSEKGKIGFIGDETSSIYQKLKSQGVNIEKYSLDNVQGKEFPYVIIDLPWNIKNPDSLVDHIRFVQALYTTLTRGKEASIFIDNGLSDLIGNNTKDFYTSKAVGIKDSVQEFITQRTKALQEIVNALPKEEISSNDESQQTTQTQPSNTEQLASKTPPEAPPIKEESTVKEMLPTETLTPEPTTPDYDPSVETLTDVSKETVQEEVNKELEKTGDKVIDEVAKTVSTPKIVEESGKIKYDIPIRAYGFAELSGVSITSERITDSDGVKVNPWKNNLNGQKRDIAIFNSKEIIDNFREQQQAVRKLRNLRSLILYKHNLKAVNLKQLGLADVITPATNIEYYLEVREAIPGEQFLRRGRLSQIKRLTGKIGEKPLLYNLVGRFKNKKGENCTVTLAMLQDPETFDKYIRSINTSSLDPDETQRIQNLGIAYRNAISSMNYKFYNGRKEFKPQYYKVLPDSSGLTDVKYTLLDDVVQHKPLSEFREQNQNLTISQPYIYTGDIDSASEGTRGRAVVFITADTTIKDKSQLPQLYLKQKQEALEKSKNDKDFNVFKMENSPSVRMVRLYNRGVSISSILNFGKYKDLYQTIQDGKDGKKYVNKFPVDVDYFGPRLFATLWNFRVNLINFMNEYNAFKARTNISDEMIINSKPGDPVFTEMSQFNRELASKVREFRLSNKMAIGKLNIDSPNKFYKSVNPLGVYITPSVAQSYLSQINAILESLKKFYPLTYKDNDGSIKEYPANWLVSTQTEKYNSLSGFITQQIKNNLGIRVHEDNSDQEIEVTLPKEKPLKNLPRVLADLFHKIYLYQDNQERFNADKNSIRITQDGNIWEDWNYKEEILPYIDSSFNDMLNLAVHGTIGEYAENKNAATDAYFKHGIYVDPMVGKGVAVTQKDNLLFKPCATNERLLDMYAIVDSPIVDVTIDQQFLDSTNGEPIEFNDVTLPITENKIIENKPVESPQVKPTVAQQTVKTIQDNSSNFKLTKDNLNYVDSKGNKYARVTSIKYSDLSAGPRFNPKSLWITPSTTIGNSVDMFVRDYFEARNSNKSFDAFGKYKNATREQWQNLKNQLDSVLAPELEKRGLHIVPEDVVAYGSLSLKDGRYIPTAGTLDILAYDNDGNYHIFDMKTFHGREIRPEQLLGYRRQVTMYKNLLEQTYNIKIDSLNIIPISVNYPSPADVKYTTKDKQLLMDGIEYSDSKPILMYDGILKIDPLETVINYDSLTDNEKSLVRGTPTIASQYITTMNLQPVLSGDTEFLSQANALGLKYKVADIHKINPATQHAIEDIYSKLTKELGYSKLNGVKADPYLNQILQANMSDSIFIIGQPWKKHPYIVARGLQLGKPIHFYNQNTNVWETFNGNKFVIEDTPKLTKNFTAFVNNTLSDNAKQVIANLFKSAQSSTKVAEPPKRTGWFNQTTIDYLNLPIEKVILQQANTASNLEQAKNILNQGLKNFATKNWNQATLSNSPDTVLGYGNHKRITLRDTIQLQDGETYKVDENKNIIVSSNGKQLRTYQFTGSYPQPFTLVKSIAWFNDNQKSVFGEDLINEASKQPTYAQAIVAFNKLVTNKVHQMFNKDMSKISLSTIISYNQDKYLTIGDFIKAADSISYDSNKKQFIVIFDGTASTYQYDYDNPSSGLRLISEEKISKSVDNIQENIDNYINQIPDELKEDEEVKDKINTIRDIIKQNTPNIESLKLSLINLNDRIQEEDIDEDILDTLDSQTDEINKKLNDSNCIIK